MPQPQRTQGRVVAPPAWAEQGYLLPPPNPQPEPAQQGGYQPVYTQQQPVYVQGGYVQPGYSQPMQVGTQPVQQVGTQPVQQVGYSQPMPVVSQPYGALPQPVAVPMVVQTDQGYLPMVVTVTPLPTYAQPYAAQAAPRRRTSVSPGGMVLILMVLVTLALALFPALRVAVRDRIAALAPAATHSGQKPAPAGPAGTVTFANLALKTEGDATILRGDVWNGTENDITITLSDILVTIDGKAFQIPQQTESTMHAHTTTPIEISLPSKGTTCTITILNLKDVEVTPGTITTPKQEQTDRNKQ